MFGAACAHALIMTPTQTSRALCTLASLLCFTVLSGCPKVEDNSGSGGTAGTSVEAGKGGAAPQAGKAGAGQAQAGKAGTSPTAGSTGSAGKVAAGGAGGRSSAEEDAGVVGLRCGTRGGVSCGADEFCNFEPDKECGATDKGGLCEDKPQICTTIYAPVCGCDDQTYASDCTAHSKGVSVQYEGECKGASQQGGGGKTCGGFAALKCASGEFCNYEKSAGGQGCDGKIADAAGVCQTQSAVCTREYKPVCGCDKKTYSTACTAHAAGMSVLHDGACTVKDCEAEGGRVAVGTGPAPMCNADEKEHTSIINDDGSMAIEGMLCCVKK